MHKNPVLYANIKAYVIAAIEQIDRSPDKNCLSSDPSDLPGLRFVLSYERLKQLPEHDKCWQSIRDDKTISSQLNVMFGIHISRHRSPTLIRLMNRLPNLGIYREVFKFNAEYFDREYKNFEDIFYENFITYEAIVPVTGSLVNKPITLNSNLQLCLVTRKELIRALPEDKEPRLSQLTWAICARYKLPKVVGSEIESNLSEAEKNDGRRNKINLLIDSVLACLRLFGISNVSPTANIHRTTSFIFENNQSFYVRPLPYSQFNLIFDRDISSDFILFWKKFQAATDKYKNIAVAVRRYNFSYERHNIEDKIIDLLIAAEALFLLQKEKDSITSRLTERAALFLADDESIRKQITETFRSAYKLRSNIVHGNTETSKMVDKIAEKEIPLYGNNLRFEQFVSRVQNYIQLSIVKMINWAEKNEDSSLAKPLINWKEFVNTKKSTEQT